MNDESTPAGAAAPFQFSPRTLMVGVFVVSVAIAIVVVLVRKANESAKKAQCRERLQLIALAMQNFRDTYQGFPPASIVDADGKPMHSWRVLIVPFIEKNWFYDRYHIDEPWDGPNNRPLQDIFMIDDDGFGHSRDITEIRWVYRCPAAPASQGEMCTNYVMIVDTDSPPLEAKPRSWWQKDTKYYPPAGGSIMVVEIASSDIHWMEPRDLSLREMSFLINDSSKPSISSQHVGGAFVMLKDGTVEFLDESTTEERLEEMLLRTSSGKTQ